MSKWLETDVSKKRKSPPVTVPRLQAMKGKEKIAMLTAYDYPTARLLDESGIDVILVGDSLGTVVYGEPNTLSVELDDMIRHCQAVSKAAGHALVVGDLPFLSYQVSKEQAIESAGKLLKYGKVNAVKLEGGIEIAPTVEAISRAGIPVMAHIGLTPQSINAMGQYRMHGKSEAEYQYLVDSALALEKAGAFSIVLECVTTALAEEVTLKCSIPTIGIGSGKSCDGQVLVIHDLLGLTVGHVPKFVKPEANLSQVIREAVERYQVRTKQDSEMNEPQQSEKDKDQKNSPQNDWSKEVNL